jgi:glycosyltransferase involved in cell wall biosynthesis
VAIDAFNRREERLVVVGTGPEEERLRRRAGRNVHWRGNVSREELRRLYQRCRASLLPGVEDFGIAPLETQACGRPVVALAAGGARETVKDGLTGILYDEPTAEALCAAVDRLSSLRLNKSDLRAWALGFSRERFRSRIESFIQAKVGWQR